MKKIILPALLLSGWLFFIHTDIPVGENFLPAQGRFLNPFHGIWRNVISDEGSFHLNGLTQGEVKILFDERDVPHIYASTLEDAIYAQGYLHASNRLFAMDISTRAASGTVSELVGSRATAFDLGQREKGFDWLAQQKAEAWEKFEKNKSILDAYVRGVNAFTQTLTYDKWPIEYKILSKSPVTWTTKHTALMATNMAIMLCMAENDLDNSKARAALSPDQYAYLYPERNAKESPVIPSERKWDFIPVATNGTTEKNPVPLIKSKNVNDKLNDINGSNSWAVSGKKTLNGNPILANDPHLNLTLPNIWYEMEIHTPEFSVHGASIPGLPFIIIGFTETFAWGTTNSGQDVLDWYRIKWKDDTRQEYLLDGKYERVEPRIEEIKVRGGKTIIDTVRYTYWGPVMSDGDHKDMAMKWIPHERTDVNDLNYLYLLHHGSTISDYHAAMTAYQYPAQNKIFASVDGDIAMTVAGVIPLRIAEQGQYIQSGEEKKNDWQGFIPSEHSPVIVNPTIGFVSSANQIPVDTTYPYPVPGIRYFEDYRGRVINTILDSMEQITVDDMKQLQQNNFNLLAAELLPQFLKILNDAKCITTEDSVYAVQLSGWNFEHHRDSLSPVLFQLWYDEFERIYFDELDSMGLMHPEDWRIVEMVNAKEEVYTDIVSTSSKKETLLDLICTSYNAMIEQYNELDKNVGKNWGSYKGAEVSHIARLTPFGIHALHTSGSKHIVNAMGKTHGPSWRMVVELSKPIKAWVNYPGGQSGNPASKHYHDMLDQFFEGKYYEVSLKKDPSSWTPARQITIVGK